MICSARTAHSLPGVEGERTVLLRSGAVKVRLRRSSRARRLRLVLIPGTGPELVVPPARARERDRRRARPTLAPWLERALARQQPGGARASRGRASPGTAARPIALRFVDGEARERRLERRGARAARARIARARRGRSSAGTAARRARRSTASIERQAQAIGVAPKSLAVRDQRTRWGSCSSRGTLSFSWRLLLAPAWVLDDVVCHELCHLRVANHSKAFWELFASTGRPPTRARGCARTAASLPPTGRRIASASP